MECRSFAPTEVHFVASTSLKMPRQWLNQSIARLATFAGAVRSGADWCFFLMGGNGVVRGQVFFVSLEDAARDKKKPDFWVSLATAICRMVNVASFTQNYSRKRQLTIFPWIEYSKSMGWIKDESWLRNAKWYSTYTYYISSLILSNYGPQTMAVYTLSISSSALNKARPAKIHCTRVDATNSTDSGSTLHKMNANCCGLYRGAPNKSRLGCTRIKYNV